jgi:formyl-CoA transferase
MAEATGSGQHVDVSILEGLASSHAQDLIDYEYLGLVRRRGDLRTPIPCADGLVSFAVQAHQYKDFQRLILGDSYASNDDDVIERDRRRREGEMDTDILLWAAERTKLQAYQEAQEAHIPAAYMADAADVMQSPQLRSRGFFKTIEHPKAGRHEYAGLPARISGVDPEFRSAPLLGQHTDVILKDWLGISPSEIEELKAAGVI